MQGYPYKVKENRSDCFGKDERTGTVKVTCRYYLPKDGLKLTVDGCELIELRAVSENGSDTVMFKISMPDGKGGKSEDVMSPKNWGIFVLNHSAVVRLVKGVAEGEKNKDSATKKACLEFALPFKNLSATTLKAMLKAEGYSETAQDYAVYEIGKAAEIEAAKVKK